MVIHAGKRMQKNILHGYYFDISQVPSMVQNSSLRLIFTNYLELLLRKHIPTGHIHSRNMSKFPCSCVSARVTQKPGSKKDAIISACVLRFCMVQSVYALCLKVKFETLFQVWS